MSFLYEEFCLNVDYGNILLNFALKEVKIRKIKNIFFLPTSNRFAIQNNPLKELHLILHKTLIKTNWKSENLNFLLNLAAFQQLRKLWKGVGIEIWYKFFYRNFLFIFFYCFTHFFPSAFSQFFFFNSLLSI